jgi:hypothetical protein
MLCLEEIHIFTSYYDTGNRARQMELDMCLKRNLQVNEIARIHIFLEDDIELPYSSPKLRIIRTDARLSYRKWIEETSLLGGRFISLLCNSDIFFDDTVVASREYLAKERGLLALTRWEFNGVESEAHGNPKWSQDVWGINSSNELSAELLAKVDFNLGTPRCDNKLAYIFAVEGWRVYNPHHHIRTHHVHNSQLRTYNAKLDHTLKGTVAYVLPTDSPDVPSALEFDTWTLGDSDVVSATVNQSLVKWLKQNSEKKKSMGFEKESFWKLFDMARQSASTGSTVEFLQLKERLEQHPDSASEAKRLLIDKLLNYADYVLEGVVVEGGGISRNNNLSLLNLDISSISGTRSGVEDFGIIVFAHTRQKHLRSILESLKKAGELHNTEVWFDGHQGKWELRQKIEKCVAIANEYSLKRMQQQQASFGFRKMMLLGLAYMCRNYNRFVVLEDDCFPSRNAVNEFRDALDVAQGRDDILTVYGHHFGMSEETGVCSRFQGWGWGANTEKFIPVLEDLYNIYNMTEIEYLEFVDKHLTEEIQSMIEVTPPRQPTVTLKNFFAWDETLGLLAAMRGYGHMPTKRRCIFNCGMGIESTHFPVKDKFRKPPYNMITVEEVWEYF